MSFEGFTDVADARRISGWVFNPSGPDESLSVDILLDDQVVATICADEFRPDLLAIGKGNGRHGFSYTHGENGMALPLVARVAGWLIPLGSFLSASRYQGKFNHALERGLPEYKTGFTVLARAGNEGELVDRLITAYLRATADQPRTDEKKDMWSVRAGGGHRELMDLLRSRNHQAVTEYLRQAPTKPITDGITQGETVTRVLRARSDARQRVAGPFADYLVSLAEFLSVLNVECSDQNSTWGENFYREPQELIDRINIHTGFDIVPPAVMGGSFGLETATGVLTGRDLMSLHTAIRLQQIADSSTVCEIGGGLGGVAYYANRLGNNRYTIIDLPLINVLQGYYLSRALPDKAIRFYGEPANEGAEIQLLPAHCFNEDYVQFDVLLNQDSMPEIHREISIAYLTAAARKAGHLFLSINQEARAILTGEARQNVVSELVSDAGGYIKLSRNRHWIRPGYVEEIYRSLRG